MNAELCSYRFAMQEPIALDSADSRPKPSRSVPRIALYSHDTMGLGHMRRNLLIAGTVRQSALRPDVLMITGAHAANGFTMPPGVDCLTLPALYKEGDGRYRPRRLAIPLPELLALRTQTMFASLRAFEPDVLIVDNVPRGAIRELDPVLRYLRANGGTRCVLGLRDVLDEPGVVQREWHSAANESAIRDFYDAIWVYGDPSVYDMVSEYDFPPHVKAKVQFTGYDERLDGVRLHYERDELTLELSVTRENDRDLLNDVDAGRTDNYLLYGYWESEEIDVGELEIEDVLLGGYVLLRDGRAPDEEDLQFLGLRTYGELIERFDYWLEAAYVQGTGANRANEIRGYGFDLGGTYRFDLPWRPSITVGYAVGSGDDDPDDGTDSAFRQTGLQDNQDSIGKGVMSFRYYGTLLEPELSNLSITTLAFTMKPTEDSSIHLLHHGYRQQRALDELRDTHLDADPNGDSRDIGSAIDLVLGVDFQRLSVELELGYFMPGAAFDADQDDPAFFMETEFKYRF